MKLCQLFNGHDASILVTTVQSPSKVDAAVGFEAGGQDHEVALLREMVGLKANPAILYVFGLAWRPKELQPRAAIGNPLVKRSMWG